MSRYYDYEGFELPSVTTICGQLDKSGGLVQWAANTTASYIKNHFENLETVMGDELMDVCDEAPKEFRNVGKEAMDIGSIVHDLCQSYFEKTPFNHNAGDVPEVKNCWEAFMKWVNDYNPKPLRTEFKVYNTKEGYAGTADLLCEIDGYIYLVDYKTSKSIYREYHYQTCLYSQALVAEEPGAWGDETAVLRLDKQTGEYQFKTSPNFEQDLRLSRLLPKLWWATHPRKEKAFLKASGE